LKAIAYINGLKDHICSTGFCVVTPKKKFYPKFGYYLLQSDYFVQKIVSESVGVSYPAISSTEIGNMKIVIPSIQEQAEISRHLDEQSTEIDALISANEATIEKLKEYRQSVIYEAVTGKVEI
jgi:type I restriction enzyme S subunit